MKKLTLGEKIRHFMDLKGIGPSDLGRRATIPLPSVKAYLSDKAKPGAETLRAISDALEVSADELLDTHIKMRQRAADVRNAFVLERTSIPEDARREMLEVVFQTDGDVALLEQRYGARFPVNCNVYVVPKLSSTAAAGLGKEALDAAPFVEVMAFESAWLERRLGLRQGECALAEVRGDSMTPTLLDGDLVLIDTRSQAVDDSGVFVFVQEDKVRIKRIQKRLNGSLKVVSDNPAYEPEELSPVEGKGFRVIGRVVWPRLR